MHGILMALTGVLAPVILRAMADKQRNSVAYYVVGLVGLLLVAGSGCGEREETAEAPSGRSQAPSRITFEGLYTFDGPVLENEDLSGIACISPTHCLIGSDEGRAVQAVELSRSERTLRVLSTIELLPSGDEIDIEAIAAEGDCYYIIGSHGLAKKSGRFQENRYKLFRMRVDRDTGLPVSAAGSLAVASLADVLRNDPVLGPYFAKPLQQKGINIEGLAIRDGQLFVGLRNPNLDGFAHVIQVGADDVFASVGQPQYTLHRLRLGEGLGIREMVATRAGFLIIAGNAGSEPSENFPESVDYEQGRGYWMFSWSGKGPEVNNVGKIPNTPAKAEAMTVLDESDDHTTVLILFDGVENGRPSVYRID